MQTPSRIGMWDFSYFVLFWAYDCLKGKKRNRPTIGARTVPPRPEREIPYYSKEFEASF
jgi:hypothetical protein